MPPLFFGQISDAVTKFFGPLGDEDEASLANVSSITQKIEYYLVRARRIDRILIELESLIGTNKDKASDPKTLATRISLIAGLTYAVHAAQFLISAKLDEDEDIADRKTRAEASHERAEAPSLNQPQRPTIVTLGGEEPKGIGRRAVKETPVTLPSAAVSPVSSSKSKSNAASSPYVPVSSDSFSNEVPYPSVNKYDTFFNMEYAQEIIDYYLKKLSTVYNLEFALNMFYATIAAINAGLTSYVGPFNSSVLAQNFLANIFTALNAAGAKGPIKSEAGIVGVALSLLSVDFLLDTTVVKNIGAALDDLIEKVVGNVPEAGIPLLPKILFEINGDQMVQDSLRSIAFDTIKWALNKKW